MKVRIFFFFFLHHIFESENFRLPFFYEKKKGLNLGVEI